MSLRPPTRTIVLLLSLLSASAYYAYDQYVAERARIAVVEKYKNETELSRAKTLPDLRRRFIAGKDDLISIPSAMRAAVWPLGERERVRTEIAGEHYDYIVLPMQEISSKSDRTTRMMVARWIADELEHHTHKRVMSPELAQRILGATEIRFDDARVGDLARSVGAEVVHVYAQPKYIKPETLVALALADAAGTIKSMALVEVPIAYDTYKVLLENVVQPSVPKLVATLTKTGYLAERKRTIYQNTNCVFPEHMDGLLHADMTPLDQAVYLQLLAALTPQGQQYERRRLYERSLVALKQIDPSSEDYNLLTARALFYLFRRPDAVKLLQNPKRPEEQALLAYLNGNYPELKAVLPSITNPVLYVMSYLEFFELGYSYNKPRPTDVPLPLVSEQWRILITLASHDSDSWSAEDNIPFFISIAGLMPSFDHVYKEMLEEQVAAGNTKPFGANQNVIDAVFTKLNAQTKPDASVNLYGPRLARADEWNLYRNLALGNVIHHLDRDIYTYGSYDTARRYAEQLEPWLQGNAAYASGYAKVLISLANNTDGKEKHYLQQQAYEQACQAIVQGGGSDDDVVRGTMIVSSLNEFSNPADPKDVVRSFAMAHRDAKPAGLVHSAVYDVSVLYPYTNTSLEALIWAYKHNKISEDVLDKELSKRFDGNPDKVGFLGGRLEEQGKENEAMALFKDAIAQHTDAWTVFYEQAKLLLRAGHPKAAAEALNGYPYFSTVPKGMRVAVANYAEDAGSLLYWNGYYDEARPFFKKSASLDTGAGAEFIASERLASLDGNYNTAAGFAYANIQRYNSAPAIRRYLIYLYLFGKADVADASFKVMVRRYPNSGMWTAKSVEGHMQGRSLNDSVNWTQQFMRESDSSAVSNEAYRRLFLDAIEDRVVSPATLALLDSLPKDAHQVPANTIDNRDRPVSALYAESKTDAVLAPAKGMRLDWIDEEYQFFLHGYAALHDGNFDQAVLTFLRLEERQPLITKHYCRFEVPYLAMASAKGKYTTRIPGLEKLLDQPMLQHDFHALLSRAVIAQQQGNTDRALEFLIDARNRIYGGADRVYDGWYEMIQVAEWVYLQSGDQRVLQQALTWAKTNQILQFPVGWSFAFEARYSTVENDRVRAAAFAEYLDRNSAWLHDVPPAIREKGALWWRTHNPYVIPKEHGARPNRAA